MRQKSGDHDMHGTLPSHKEDVFNRIVGLIYSAPLAPQYWGELLSATAESFGAFGAQINMLDPSSSRPMIAITHGCEWLTPERLKRFIELSPTDPRLPYAISHPGMPNHCRQSCTEAALHASPMYKEILGPGNAEYILGFTLPDPNGIIAFGTMRGKEAGPFNQDDCGRLGLLIPHLRRALKAQTFLSQTAYTQQLATMIFDSMSMAAMLLTSELHLLFSNAAADRILKSICIQRDTNNKISLADQDSTEELIRAVRRIISIRPDEPLPPPALLDISIPGQEPMQMVVTSIRDERAQRLLGNVIEPCALVLFANPETPLEALGERLQRLFGLTPSECTVAESIVAGKGPRAHAIMRDLSHETVRSQLKAIFRKTRTSSQPELLRLLRNLPEWPQSPPPCDQDSAEA